MRGPRLRLALLAVLAFGATASTRDLAEADDPASPAGGARRCTVTGRIVDGWKAGVRDAKVAWIGDAPSRDRSTAAAVRTDENGRFRLEIDGPAGDDVRGMVHATRGDDAAAFEPLVVGAGERERDLEPVALAPARPLVVRVQREGKPAADAQVWLWIDLYRSDLPSFVGTAKTDATGRVELGAFPSACLRVQAQARGGSVGAEVDRLVPGSAPSRVTVELVPSRTVDVLVTTDDSPARPIAGAAVSRTYGVYCSDVVRRVTADVPNRIDPTGADGHVRVDGLPADRTVELEARIEGRPRGRVRCGPGKTFATIAIPAPLSIPVTNGERPRPPDGTRIRVRTWRDAVDVPASMVDGKIAVPLLEHQVGGALAVAPDGSLAVLDGVHPTSFSRPRSLVVRIVEKDGRAVAGARVSLAPSPYVRGPWDTPIPTDDEGRARFDGLASWKHVVEVDGARTDEVFLLSSDYPPEVTVGPEVTLLLRVTIDGRPGIPEWLRWTMVQSTIILESSADRASGVLRIRARAQGSSVISLEGKGVRPRAIPFAWPARGETTSIDAPLFASPEVVMDVRADPDSDVNVGVERWTPWRPWDWSRWRALDRAFPSQAGRTTIDLPEGRYRLRDRRTGIVSEAFDVPDRGAPVAATLDLTGLVTVRGRVEVPSGFDADAVELRVDGDGIDPRSPLIPGGMSSGLPYDGTSFALHIPAGRRVTISPSHPRLQPARDDGEVTLVGPRDDVVLRMGAGATLVATLTDPSGRPLTADELRNVSITTTPTAHPSREPQYGEDSLVVGKPGTVSASGLPFGTQDVWIEVRGFATRRLTGTVIASDTTDLGEIRLTRGSTLRLRNVGKDLLRKLSPDAAAYGTFGPHPHRFLESSPEAAADVLGHFPRLCEGHWRIELGAVGEGPVLEIDVDGEHDQTLDVDFDALPRADR